jgi:hypothetical protein
LFCRSQCRQWLEYNAPARYGSKME